MFSKYFNMISPFIDSFGVIVPKSGDGGDSLQREGMFMTSEALHFKKGMITKDELDTSTQRYRVILSKLFVSWGNFRRHPDRTKWYGQPDRMSRDQLTSNIVAMGFVYRSMLLKTFIGHLFKRLLLFTTNTKNNGVMPGDFGYYWKVPDITAFAIWGAYLRGFGPWLYPVYPIVWLLCSIFDLENLINVLIANHTIKTDPTVCDTLSLQMLLDQARFSFPTLTSWVARRLFEAGPLCNKPQDGKSSTIPAQQDLNLYFDGNPPMDDIYADINEIIYKD